MFVRFAGAMMLVFLIASAGIHLEKQNLELRRAVGLQHYRLDVLERRHALRRLKVQQLGAPVRLIEPLESGRLQVRIPEKASPTGAKSDVIAGGERLLDRVH